MRKIWGPSTKASKAKHRKWASRERFTMGHDAACMALLPEYEQMADLKGDKRTPRSLIGVYRSDSFGQSNEERIEADAIFLLNSGRAGSIDNAVDIATRNWRNGCRGQK